MDLSLQRSNVNTQFDIFFSNYPVKYFLHRDNNCVETITTVVAFILDSIITTSAPVITVQTD